MISDVIISERRKKSGWTTNRTGEVVQVKSLRDIPTREKVITLGLLVTVTVQLVALLLSSYGF